MNTILILYLILIVAPISNLIHEFGHMLGAKIAKADHVQVYIGRGKSIIKLPFQKTEIHFGTFFFTSGLTISQRKDDYHSIEIIIITILGPLLNAIIVFISYLLYNNVPSIFILLFLLYNAWLFITNIIPFKLGKKESDGYIIVKEFFRSMYTNR